MGPVPNFRASDIWNHFDVVPLFPYRNQGKDAIMKHYAKFTAGIIAIAAAGALSVPAFEQA
jgi:hypothetical protein